MQSLPIAKGHGTENDFVIVPDVDGTFELTRQLVVALTDRRRGIGGDGVLRIVRAAAHPEADTSAPWFMDYRNADGSISEMCGNGVRVYAQYLRESGLDQGERIAISTRGGTKIARFEDDGAITVDMGPPRILGVSGTQIGDVAVEGLAVSMGNPHLAVDLAKYDVGLERLDLATEPKYDRTFFPRGVNQEFYRDADPMSDFDAHVHMRVHERGVGETRSCGTGICAVAVAALGRTGLDAGRVVVDVPGGRLYTEVSPERVFLRGPAVIVARGEFAYAAGGPAENSDAPSVSS